MADDEGEHSERREPTLEVQLDELEPEPSRERVDSTIERLLGDLEAELPAEPAAPSSSPPGRPPSGSRPASIRPPPPKGGREGSIRPPPPKRPATDSIPPPSPPSPPRPATGSIPPPGPRATSAVRPAGPSKTAAPRPPSPPPAARPPTLDSKAPTSSPARPRTIPPPLPRKAPGLGKPASLPPPAGATSTAVGVAAPSDPVASPGGETDGDALARDLAEQFEKERDEATDTSRKARLSFELGRVYEERLGDRPKALAAYEAALAYAPEHLPTLRALRRVLSAQRSHRAALPHLETEARLTADPRRKAALLYLRGRLLEDVLSDDAKAREAYAVAAELDRDDPAILKALERRAHDAQDWATLERTYERSANAVGQDARHRAALVIERARLLEQKQGNIDGAIELYETGLRLDPTAAGALESLERLLHGERRFRDLIRALERRVERSGSAAERAGAYYRIAQIHAERLGNRDEAIAALERALTEREGDALVLEALAVLYERADRHEALVEVLGRLATDAPTEQEQIALHQRIGQIFDEHLGRPEEARAAYERALALGPDQLPTLQALGRIYEVAGDYEALCEMHIGEARVAPSKTRRAAAHARVAEVLERKLGRPEEAMEHHARALSLDPEHGGAFKALGRLYASAGRWRELVALHEQALERARRPEPAITHLFKIGGVYEDALDEPAQAAHAYRRILELEPKHLGAIHALQRASERAERFADLVEALELEVALDPDSPRAATLLARAAEVLDESMGDRDGAISRYRRVLELEPAHAGALTGLGRIYHRAGRWEDLLALYHRELEPLEAGPPRALLLYRMGRLCEERIGREDQALELYRQALDADPSHRPSLAALAERTRARRDYPALAEVLELEVSALKDPEARARAAYRLGEVREEHLGQPDRAVAAYELAIAAVPEHGPSKEALTRLRAAQGAWRKLAEALEAEGRAEADEARGIGALARAGEIWSLAVGDAKRGASCYEAVLELEPRHIDALLALERLYRKLRRVDALMINHAAQARVLADPKARVAALRELSRLQQKTSAEPAAQRRTEEAILSLAPDDPLALSALETIAIETGDRALLAQLDARLADKVTDPKLASTHRARLAESLELRGDTVAAFAAFRAALENDPDNIAAALGLRRVARSIDDPRARLEAAKGLASATRDPERRAAAYRDAAEAAEALDDPAQALSHYERALELWPDEVESARGLLRLATARGLEARAADRLARAASSARRPERTSELLLDVARLSAGPLENPAAAIGALERLLEAAPKHVPARRELAALHRAEGRAREAARELAQVVELAGDRATLEAAHLGLAELYAGPLDEPPRALLSLQAVLSLDPNHAEALDALATVHARAGRVDEAREALMRWLAGATDPIERAARLARCARFEMEHGLPEHVDAALLEAIALVGPFGDAGQAHRERITGPEGWDVRAATIERWLTSGRADPDLVERGWAELARIHGEELSRPEAAVTALERAVETAPEDPSARRRLAVGLRRADRHEEAAAELRSLLANDVTGAEVWRELAATFAAAGDEDAAKRALAPLVILDRANPAERRALGERRRRVAGAMAGTLDRALLEALYPTRRAGPVTELLRVCRPALTKLYPADLDGFGLGSRDRLTERSGAAVRTLADRVAVVFGLDPEAFSLYVHRTRGRGVAIELAEPPALLLPAGLLELDDAGQAFAIARHLAHITLEIWPVDKLTPRELETILAAAARKARPGFGAGLAGEETLDDLSKRLYRALPRRARRPAEDAAASYVEAPAMDFAHLVEAMNAAAQRAALFVADDLGAAVDVLRRTERDLAQLEGAALLQSPMVARLARFWVSPELAALRQRAGLDPATR